MSMWIVCFKPIQLPLLDCVVPHSFHLTREVYLSDLSVPPDCRHWFVAFSSILDRFVIQNCRRSSSDQTMPNSELNPFQIPLSTHSTPFTSFFCEWFNISTTLVNPLFQSDTIEICVFAIHPCCDTNTPYSVWCVSFTVLHFSIIVFTQCRLNQWVLLPRRDLTSTATSPGRIMVSLLLLPSFLCPLVFTSVRYCVASFIIYRKRKR